VAASPAGAVWRRGLHTSPRLLAAHGGDWSNVAASASSMRVSNPIRDIVDQLDLSRINPDKQ
jgi:hypothetical protein